MQTTQVSDRYRGERGQDYVDTKRWADGDHRGYDINFSYFRPHLSASDTVLDFGCGNGGLLRRLSGFVKHAEGLEVNASAAKLARASGHTVYGSLDEIPHGTLYDAIVTNHVLEHVRDVCATLETLRGHLKPGGKLVAKLPIDDFRSKYQQGWSADDKDHHLQTWSPRLFANVLFESGYEVEACRVITSAWHPRLFPLSKVGLDRLAYWAFAVVRRRRQLFAVGRSPSA